MGFVVVVVADMFADVDADMFADVDADVVEDVDADVVEDVVEDVVADVFADVVVVLLLINVSVVEEICVAKTSFLVDVLVEISVEFATTSLFVSGMLVLVGGSDSCVNAGVASPGSDSLFSSSSVGIVE
jgi:hypothetical protein